MVSRIFWVLAMALLVVGCKKDILEIRTPDYHREFSDSVGERKNVIDSTKEYTKCMSENRNMLPSPSMPYMTADMYCRNRAAISLNGTSASAAQGMMPGSGMMMPGYGLGMVMTPNTGAVTLYGGYGSKDQAVANAQSVQTTVGMGPGTTPPGITLMDRAQNEDILTLKRRLDAKKE